MQLTKGNHFLLAIISVLVIITFFNIVVMCVSTKSINDADRLPPDLHEKVRKLHYTSLFLNGIILILGLTLGYFSMPRQSDLNFASLSSSFRNSQQQQQQQQSNTYKNYENVDPDMIYRGEKNIHPSSSSFRQTSTVSDVINNAESVY